MRTRNNETCPIENAFQEPTRVYFLSDKLMKENIIGIIIITTDGQHVVCYPPRARDYRLCLAYCNQDDADTRTMVHIMIRCDIRRTYVTRVMIRTIDTD